MTKYLQTSQELQMLSSVRLFCKVPINVVISGFEVLRYCLKKIKTFKYWKNCQNFQQLQPLSIINYCKKKPTSLKNTSRINEIFRCAGISKTYIVHSVSESVGQSLFFWIADNLRIHQY